MQAQQIVHHVQHNAFWWVPLAVAILGLVGLFITRKPKP